VGTFFTEGFLWSQIQDLTWFLNEHLLLRVNHYFLGHQDDLLSISIATDKLEVFCSRGWSSWKVWLSKI